MENEVKPEIQAYRIAEHAIDAAFLNRWSPRAFSPEPIGEDVLMSVFEAARWAASSSNEQPWRFLIARSDTDRQKFLSFLAPTNQIWAKFAPVLVVIVSKKTFVKNDKPNAVYAYDAGTCSGYMTLQASLNGLVAHGMAGFDAEMARTTLNIPADFVPFAVYAIGKPGNASDLPPNLQERETPSGRRPIKESIIEGGFFPSH